MGFIATDLATVPVSPQYTWYLFLLEDHWQDELRRQIADNFMNLAREVGPDALVVRGARPKEFYSQVLYEYALADRMDRYEILPAILVADTPPHKLRLNDQAVRNARIVLFPLASMASRPADLTAFLQTLSATVRSPEAFDSLKRLDKDEVRKRWCWVTRYLELKPSFLGFGVDINAIVEDLWDRTP